MFEKYTIPFDTIHVDHLVSLIKTKAKNENISYFRDLFVPAWIVSDRGVTFTSMEDRCPICSWEQVFFLPLLDSNVELWYKYLSPIPWSLVTFKYNVEIISSDLGDISCLCGTPSICSSDHRWDHYTTKALTLTLMCVWISYQ